MKYSDYALCAGANSSSWWLRDQASYIRKSGSYTSLYDNSDITTRGVVPCINISII